MLGKTGNEDVPTVRASVSDGCEGGFAGMTDKTRVPEARASGSMPGPGMCRACTFGISTSVVMVDEVIDTDWSEIDKVSTDDRSSLRH